MRGIWNTGLKPFGVPLKIHWTFLLWFIALWSFGWWLGIQALLVLMVSLLVHEYAHILAARSVGLEASDVVMYIFGGAARIPGMARLSLGHEAYVAVMGPVSSFAFAAVIFLLSVILGTSAPWIIGYAMLVNIAIGIFNFLPLYPMDGGRLLRVALVTKLGTERGTKAAVWTTAILGGLLGLVSLAYGYWNITVIMVLVILMAFGEHKQVTVSKES